MFVNINKRLENTSLSKDEKLNILAQKMNFNLNSVPEYINVFQNPYNINLSLDQLNSFLLNIKE